MIKCQKHLFNLPLNQTYLNGAYMSPLTKHMVKTANIALLHQQQPGNYRAADFFEPVEEIKQAFSKLINNPDLGRIAIVPSVSYGMATVAKNLPISAKQHIVVAADQFPSNYFPWQKLTEQAGAKLKVVTPPAIVEGRAKGWNELLLDAIDSSTAAVAISNLHWSDGSWFDLKAIRQRSRDVGAKLIVDGTQSVGALPFDCQEIQPDALVCASYKWLMGPYGIGLAYFGEAFDDGQPLEESWINRLGSDDFKSLSSYRHAYRPEAARYSMGEQSQLLLLPILQAGLDQLAYWGIENIQEYCKNITTIATAELCGLGCQIEQLPWRAAHLFGIRLPSEKLANSVSTALREANIIVSLRGDAIRVSPHIYNDEADLEKLVQCFSAVFLK